jgi:hypothetical protein
VTGRLALGQRFVPSEAGHQQRPTGASCCDDRRGDFGANSSSQSVTRTKRPPTTHGGCGACCCWWLRDRQLRGRCLPAGSWRRCPAQWCCRCRRGWWPNSVGSCSGSTRPAEGLVWACPPWPVGGMQGVVGWDEGAFADAGDEGPAASGFQVIVEPAQRVQLAQPGVPGLHIGLGSKTRTTCRRPR